MPKAIKSGCEGFLETNKVDLKSTYGKFSTETVWTTRNQTSSLRQDVLR